MDFFKVLFNKKFGGHSGDLIEQLFAKALEAAEWVIKTVSGAIASFSDGANDVPVEDLTIQIEPIQSGSGDPSPTNVRPISGWTGAVVQRTGINVWDEEWESGTFNGDGSETASATALRSVNYIPITPNTSYRFYSGTVDSYLVGVFYDEAKNVVEVKSGSAWGVHKGSTFTTPSNAYYMRFAYPQYGTTYNHDISINYPSTDTSYHAYQGQTHSISWEEAGTVYGGTLDVTTGLLTVDRAMVTYDGSDDENWASNGTRQYIAQLDAVGGNYVETAGKFISNYLAYNQDIVSDSSALGIILNNRNFQVRVSTSVTTVAELKQYLTESPLTVVYELDTPQTYQLTPTEVRTLLGDNNIWADTGDITVTYKTKGN